jgi:hypothetical protein
VAVHWAEWAQSFTIIAAECVRSLDMYRFRGVETKHQSGSLPSRKGHKLRIPRQAIHSYIVLLETLLHVDPPGLIKANTTILHDPLHLPLPFEIQPGPRITLHDIAAQVEVIGCETGFDIGHEGGGDAAVEGFREGWWEEVEPSGAGGVEDCDGVGQYQRLDGTQWRGDTYAFQP